VSRGQDVSIFTSKTDWRSKSISSHLGVKIHRFYAPKIVWGINPLAILFPSITAADIDIIHVHSYLYFVSNQAVLSKFLRTILGRRTSMVMHLHGGIGTPRFLHQKPTQKVTKRVYDKLFGKLSMIVSERIIAVSRSDANCAVETFKINPDKIEIVPNAIDMRQFLFGEGRIILDENKRRRVVFLGDLEQWKGVDILLKAFYHLNRIDSSFCLDMIGQGSLREALETKARSKGLPVRFFGEVPHHTIPSLLKGAYALVLPSLWEGLPTVILEAMAAGVPVIATRVGGIPEVIIDTVNGQMIEPKKPREIVRALLALDNEPFRKKIVSNAYRLIKEKYDIVPITKQIIKIYESLV